MILEFTVVIGTNDKGKEKRWVYRVHNEDLSTFLREKQRENQFIESGRCLFRKKLEQQIAPVIKDFSDEELSLAGLSREKLQEVREQVVDPIDDRIMIDSHGF